MSGGRNNGGERHLQLGVTLEVAGELGGAGDREGNAIQLGISGVANGNDIVTRAGGRQFLVAASRGC